MKYMDIRVTFVRQCIKRWFVNNRAPAVVALRLWHCTARDEVAGLNPGHSGRISMGQNATKRTCAMHWMHVKDPQGAKISGLPHYCVPHNQIGVLACKTPEINF